MSLTAVSAFTPAAYAEMSVGPASSNKALPGSGNQTLYLVNAGPSAVAVLLGGSTVAVTETTGLVLLAGQSIFLGIGSNTYIAAIALGGSPSNTQLNLAAGA